MGKGFIEHTMPNLGSKDVNRWAHSWKCKVRPTRHPLLQPFGISVDKDLL